MGLTKGSGNKAFLEASEKTKYKKGHKQPEEVKDKISKSMIGNNNAENDTDYFIKCKSILLSAIELAKTEKDLDRHGNQYPKYDFIGEVLVDLNTYDSQVLGWIKKHDSNNELKDLFNELRKIMETNCYFNAKRGNINTAVGIVNLKSHHKWTDRVDNTTKGEKITNDKDELRSAFAELLEELND